MRSTHSQDALTRLISLLQDKASQIRQIENEAHSLLQGEYDTQDYKKLMVSKCKLLAGLLQSSAEVLPRLPQETREAVQEELAGIKGRAEQALKLDSIFFMRNLLYPEDYVPGDRNDLEEFIDFLWQEAGEN